MLTFLAVDYDGSHTDLFVEAENIIGFREPLPLDPPGSEHANAVLLLRGGHQAFVEDYTSDVLVRLEG